MFVKWILFIVLCVLLWESIGAVNLKKTYHQNDYNVKLEIVEMLNMNKSYVPTYTAGLHWHNRTTRIINGNCTLLKHIGKQAKFEVQMYKFLSNEYRFFPLSITFTCAHTATNTFGVMDFLRNYSNLPTDCNVQPGYYYVKDAIFDYSQLPPYIPAGRYKLQLKLYNHPDYVGTLDVYCEIEEIRKWWK